MNLLVRHDLEELQEQSCLRWHERVKDDYAALTVGAGVNRDWLGLANLLGACCSELSKDVAQFQVDKNTGEFSTEQFFRKGAGGTLLAGEVPSLGGIFQVFQHARSLAIEIGLYAETDDFNVLTSPQARIAFSNHVISVTSSSNIGLAVGLAARALGFVAEVHFTAATAQWKIDVLRKQGATVANHRGNFQDVVAVARAQAQANPMVYHVDDTREDLLNSGYCAMALELQAQLLCEGIQINRKNPLHLHFSKESNSGQSPFALDMAMGRVFGSHVRCSFDETGHADAALGLVAGSYQGDSRTSALAGAEPCERTVQVIWHI